MRRRVELERQVEAAADAARALLVDVETWPGWMPALRSLEILQHADGIHRLRLATPLYRHGRSFDVEVLAGMRSLRLRELSAPHRDSGLRARWSWRDEPDGTATTTLRLSADAPLLHLRARRRLHSAASAWLDHLESALAARPAAVGADDEAVVYRAGDGLHLQYRSHVYRLTRDEP